MAKLKYEKTVDIRHSVDVFVAGGGPAGAAAAIAAARQGARVFLAEQQGAFGGSGTTALVPAFMPFGNGVDFLAGGIGREIFDNIMDMGAVNSGMFSSISIRAEHLKTIYDDMLVKSGVTFSFHTSLIDVIVDNGHVDSVILAAKSGVFAVKAKVFIDCTGDGDLCAWAGADYEFGNEDGITMPATLCSLWANIDWTNVKANDGRALEKAFADNVFTNEDRHLPGMWKLSEHMGGGNIGHTFKTDSTDERSLTDAMLWGRKSISEYEKYYKSYLTGFENMELAATGAYLGVRESRRIMGDYILNINDFINRAVFDDEIGRFCYCIDIHIMSPDKDSYEKFHTEHTSMRYGIGESYGIPYSCLIPKKLQNVLVAGRCVSTDRQMQSSIRVMPGCYITGQAAGVAASMVNDDGDVRKINVKDLQVRLKNIGAFLPNLE